MTRLELLKRKLESHPIPPISDKINKIIALVKERRKRCSRVIVTDNPPRFSFLWSETSLICCDEKMKKVRVFYPNNGQYSRTDYEANPEYVCMCCLRCVGPCDYDSP